MQAAAHPAETDSGRTDPADAVAAASSVVNAEQRTHDHPNLFLLGSGVFPTAGTANPTLTIAALALWAAETIKHDLETMR